MYSKKTMCSYLDKLNKTIEWYVTFPAEELELCVTFGNQKIGHVYNISLAPVRSCGNCKDCMFECYDVKACMQYENVMKARSRNQAILESNYELYWELLRDKLRRIAKSKYPFFRFHVGGEIPSARYLEDMIKTARMFPMIRFWTYTKMHELVNDYVREHGNDRREAVPENLSIQFSRWFLQTINNPYGFGEFLTVPKGEKLPEGYMKCPGNCDICIANHIGCPYGMKCGTELH